MQDYLYVLSVWMVFETDMDICLPCVESRLPMKKKTNLHLLHLLRRKLIELIIIERLK